MQALDQTNEEDRGYEKDEDMEDHVVPQMTEHELSSPMNHQINQVTGEKVLNILDPLTQILYLKDPLTLGMLKNTERKYIIKCSKIVKKATINIC
ncbi:hypothetical protein RDI58_001380 [Solanum bulbocastanum]|uniref:Uncharacterized protein n=1 Tax=Solanum bulbocastanum TaxID=147425 RepID=A0AAN8YQ58_SOLBU